MVFEDVGRVWREEGDDIRRRRIEDLSVVRSRADGFLARLYHRGRRIFALTALTVVPIFTWGAFNSPRPELVVPGVLMVFTWLGSIWIRWRQLRPPPPDVTLPVCDAVRGEVDRLRFLERFWGKVKWWSLGLFVVGEVLVFEGLRPVGAVRGPVSFGFYGLMIVIVSTIVFRNPVYAQLKVRPLREELESWIEGLQALEDVDSWTAELEGGAT